MTQKRDHRWFPVRVLVVLGVVAATLAVTTPAQACSCGTADLEHRVQDYPIVFIGAEIDRVEDSRAQWPPNEVTFRVDEVYKGDVGDEMVVYTGYGGGDCGVGSLVDQGQVAVLVWLGDGGPTIDSCGSIDSPAALRALLEGLPPVAGGPPMFLAAGRLGDARMAAVNAGGEVVGWGTGEGDVVSLAACPGGHHAVEIVQPAANQPSDAFSPRLETRDLTTMEIVEVRFLPFAPPGGDDRRGRRWVYDLQCHDADSSRVSYLVPSWEWDPLAGSDLFTDGARVHVWNGGVLDDYPVGTARALAFDPSTNQFATIEGRRGHHLEIWDAATGELLVRDDLPGGSAAWDVVLLSDGTLAIPARWTAMSDENLYYPEIDRVLLRAADGSYTETVLSDRGALRSAQRYGEGVLLTLWFDRALAGASILVVDGAVVDEWPVPGEGLAFEAAAADGVAAYRGVEGFAGLAIVPLQSDGRTGAVTSIDILGQAVDGVAALLDEDPTMAPPSTVGPVPAEVGQPPDAPPTTMVAALESPASPGDPTPIEGPGFPWLPAGGIALVAAAIGLALRRMQRRESP